MNVQERNLMKRKDKAAIHLILEKPLATALDEWRLKKRYFGSRQGAIRTILARALLGAAKGKAAA
jgi:hypothetical protein